MANPRRLPSGSWQYRFTVDGQAHAVTRRLKASAVADGEKLRDQLQAGYRPDHALTLWRLVDEWIDGRRDLSAGTVTAYRSKMRKMRDHPVMHRPVADLRPADLRQLVAWLSEHLAPSTTGVAIVPIRSALAQAEEDMLILRSPWRGVTLPSLVGTQVEARILEPEEFTRLHAAADEAGYGLDMRMLVQTGLRWGEYAGLHVDDLGVGAMQVRRTRLQTGETGPTKTRRERTVPVAAGLLTELRRLDGPTLFRPAGEARWTYKAWRRAVWDPAVAGAGLDGLRPHDMRHTAASWLLNRAGVDVKTVSAILGHTKLETTMKYLHTTPQHMADAAVRLEALVA